MLHAALLRISAATRSVTLRSTTGVSAVVLSLLISGVAIAQPADTGRWSFPSFDAGVVWSVAGVLIVLVFCVPVVQSWRNPQSAAIQGLRPAFFFWLDIVYLLVLLIAVVVYLNFYAQPEPWLVAGILPIGVAWFGALGAVTISLAGVFHYGERDWDPHFNLWHLGRPVFGAVLGVVAFFIYIIIIRSSGSTPAYLAPVADAGGPEKDYIIYYVVAFLVGYREETFRELIKRVTDMILTSKPTSDATRQIAFKIAGQAVSTIEFTAAITRRTVEVHNTGTTALADLVTVVSPAAGTLAGVFTIASPLTGGVQFPPGDTKTLDIVFTPPVPPVPGQKYSGVLIVTTASANVSATIPISAS
jgi:hypothetical protein